MKLFIKYVLLGVVLGVAGVLMGCPWPALVVIILIDRLGVIVIEGTKQ